MTDNFITFDNVNFAYTPYKTDFKENETPTSPKPIFQNFTAQIPGSFTSLVGPNGSGKSTLMLLAAGRIKPNSGSVQLFGTDIAEMDQTERNLTASFVYQNMEFESTDKTINLLKQVFKDGGWHTKKGAKGITSISPNKNFVDECIEVFELENILEHPLNKLSKGEIQRTLLAFSLLYGSKSVFLDEPLFALEYHQKKRALSYLHDYSCKYTIPFFLSMHELDLTRKYAENVLLFKPNRDLSLGTPEEVLTKEEIEKAYGVPLSMMKEAEDYNHKNKLEEAAAIADFNERIR